MRGQTLTLEFITLFILASLLFLCIFACFCSLLCGFAGLLRWSHVLLFCIHLVILFVSFWPLALLLLRNLTLTFSVRTALLALLLRVSVKQILSVFQVRYVLHRVLAVHGLLLVAHRPKVQLLQPLIIIIVEFLVIVLVIGAAGVLYCLVGLANLEVIFARELDNATPPLVVDDDEDLLIAEAAQLDGLLEEAALPLAEGDIPLRLALDEFEFIDLLLAHVQTLH